MKRSLREGGTSALSRKELQSVAAIDGGFYLGQENTWPVPRDSCRMSDSKRRVVDRRGCPLSVRPQSRKFIGLKPASQFLSVMARWFAEFLYLAIISR